MTLNLKLRLATRVFVAVCLAITPIEWNAFAQGADGGLTISVLDGDRQKEIVVRVFNGGVPAVGADVLFRLPDFGPGGRFSSGSREVNVRTDKSGRARSGNLRPNSIPGPFDVAVLASQANATAQVSVPLDNQPKASSGGGKSKWIVIGAAVAGAVGTAIILSRKKDKPPVITIGAPTVGGLQ